jgi:amino acid adenylation domain-containing protein
VAYLLWQYLTRNAVLHPERPAVASHDGALTYAELDELSDRVAGALGAAGIGRGCRVGLLMPKSHLSVAAMLGVLKAGAAYVPVDPHAPARRAAYVLGNCSVRGLFTTQGMLTQLSEHADELASLHTIVLTDTPAADASARAWTRVLDWSTLESATRATPDSGVGVESDPAFLLYTSGSTGNPKGVVLTHRNALTFVEWGGETFQVRPEDRLSNHAPLHFDLSVFDIYVALRAGATVVMVPDRLAPFPMELARWIERERITVWYSVPSALTRLLLHGKLERFEYAALRTVLFAGEVFPVKYLREVMERLGHAEFFNLYGPTETNVCTYAHVARPLSEGTDLSIGQACENTEVFAVNEQGAVTAPGETGELYVRGPTVMPGYWGLPEKSRDVLIQNPLHDAYDERVYRTGDLVRLNADGTYSFVGRKDHMVKSRGYRIELGEIEHALYQHGAVREAAVVPVADDEIGARLMAFIAPHAGMEVTETDLQAFVAARLPRYMVPETVFIRAELPQTSTGKTDRQALARSLP